MQPIFIALSFLIQLFAYVVTGYHFIVSLFAWFPRKEKEFVVDKKHTFAMVVAAHNEQSVIKNMVESLTALNYDNDLYDIYVIADNCTDKTADIAREAGAIALERFNETHRGKGYALDWAFNEILSGEKEYDAICVFDADNIAHGEFLNEINKRLCQGYEAVQGYIETKNPYDTWVTASYAITFGLMNKIYQTARYNVGLPNQLNGTGFALKTEIIKEFGWGANCLAEDMEFTMKLLQNHIMVGWAEKAIVYDEKPLTLSQSWKQRIRWTQGHADVASRFVPKLGKSFFKEGKLRYIDCIIYLLQPLLMMILAVTAVMGVVQSWYPNTKIWFSFADFGSPLFWSLLYYGQLAYVPAILWLEKKLTIKTVVYYVPYLFFTYTWLPIAFIGVAKKNKKEWFHTQHTRTISIKEVE
ncbi:MAG: glycosyltransferase [Ruminococcaceae bacterium]|nr:glycosyltransferase [Oscillospiraceae bacterium]